MGILKNVKVYDGPKNAFYTIETFETTNEEWEVETFTGFDSPWKVVKVYCLIIDGCFVPARRFKTPRFSYVLGKKYKTKKAFLKGLANEYDCHGFKNLRQVK